MPRKRSSTQGYGWHHKRLRAQLLPFAYGNPCHFCGLTMKPGQQLDLDHTDDRTSYRGMTHRACNRADGANKVNAAKRNNRDTRSRDW
jgi:hypothetical protein